MHTILAFLIGSALGYYVGPTAVPYVVAAIKARLRRNG